MLSEDKTYRTRDGSRTGIRVKPRRPRSAVWESIEDKGLPYAWHETGAWSSGEDDHQWDLIEEQPAERPFSYAACPTGPDGRKRAVMRDGREVVLVASDKPGPYPLVGWMREGASFALAWSACGMSENNPDCDLFLPPPPKRTVWVNLTWKPLKLWFDTREEADAAARESCYGRYRDRAFPIEIDVESTS